MKILLLKSISFYSRKIEDCEAGIIPEKYKPLYQKEMENRISKMANLARGNLETQSTVAIAADKQHR